MGYIAGYRSPPARADVWADKVSIGCSWCRRFTFFFQWATCYWPVRFDLSRASTMC
jgi:hypothetical protein